MGLVGTRTGGPQWERAPRRFAVNEWVQDNCAVGGRKAVQPAVVEGLATVGLKNNGEAKEVQLNEGDAAVQQDLRDYEISVFEGFENLTRQGSLQPSLALETGLLGLQLDTFRGPLHLKFFIASLIVRTA